VYALGQVSLGGEGAADQQMFGPLDADSSSEQYLRIAHRLQLESLVEWMKWPPSIGAFSQLLRPMLMCEFIGSVLLRELRSILHLSPTNPALVSALLELFLLWSLGQQMRLF
jgi:hypothetical protein